MKKNSKKIFVYRYTINIWCVPITKTGFLNVAASRYRRSSRSMKIIIALSTKTSFCKNK